VGRDPSTVGYWVKKHGLQAVHHDKHTGKRKISREALEALLDAGCSYEQAARTLGVSQVTVLRWAKKYGLASKGARRRQTAAQAEGRIVELECRHHGVTNFVKEGRGSYRCMRCRQAAVIRRRKKLKEILVADAGGRCHVCGYDRYIGGLQVHHVDPSTKEFGLGERGLTRSLDKVREEARKCVLLCGNCHAEVEAGIVALAPPDGRPQSW